MTRYVDLAQAVSDLTNPTRIPITYDDGETKPSTKHVTVRSLWEQLAQAFAEGVRMSGAHSVPSTRLPFDADVRDLRADIIDTVKDALTSYELPTDGDLPRGLRVLTAHLLGLNDEDLEGWWEYRIRSWARQIGTCLRLDEVRSRRLRDAACPLCNASHVLSESPLEGIIREPSLLIEARDQRVRAISCSACNASWWAGEDFWRLQAALAEAEIRKVACVSWISDTPERRPA